MAKVSLEIGEKYVAASNVTILGNTGSETVTVQDGVIITVDSSVERVELARASSEYTYKTSPTGMQVLFNGSVVANVTGGQNLAFTDGVAAVVMGTFNPATLSAPITLGGVVVSTTAGPIAPALVGGGVILPPSTVMPQLTITQDIITGTTGADVFNAPIIDNRNSFQSGDSINGGTGSDTLNVELGNSSAFAIRATTTNVEKLFATVQSTNGFGSNGTNNVDTSGQKATIDAEKMVGVKEFWNTDSRADLKIEDIRIDVPGQTAVPVTKDITIGLRNTDPGSMDPALGSAADHKVDYEVYFSPESLRPDSSVSSSKINFSIANQTRSTDVLPTTGILAYNDAKPLTNSPYTAVNFVVDKGTAGQVAVRLDLAAGMKTVTTYSELWTAFNNAVTSFNTASSGTATPVNLVLEPYDATKEGFLSKDGVQRFADKLTVSYAGHKLDPVDPTSPIITSGVANKGGWETLKNANDPLNAINAFSAEVRPAGAQTTNPLITSTIILDNVGREDEAGTLTIGSMSTHSGVEQFNITVENNAANNYAGTQSGSWLGHMSSTSNTLEEVYVKSDVLAAGVTADYLYVGTNMDQAGNNLTVMQDWPGSLDRLYNANTPAFSNGYTATPGVTADIQQKVNSLLNADGLMDVRVFDASTAPTVSTNADMKGNVFVGASITADSIRKYQNLVDALPTDSTDDIAFMYKTGQGNDSINLQIDGTVAASRSLNVVGRHDFSFLVDGGAGNDNIRVALVNGLNGNAENWYNNQDINANVTINGGAGNDTIRKPGAGDTTINAGTGDDTVYTDNTGKQLIVTRNADGTNGALDTTNAVYAFNAIDSNGGTVADGGYNAFDLRSQVAASVSAVNAQVTVNYLGIAKTVTIANSVNSSINVAITDLTVNQAIKDAINNDSVLNKLLIAQDGPGRTLLVSALSDGTDVAGDLAVTFGSTPLNTVQAATVGLTLFGATNANYAALTDGYAVIFAQDNVGTSMTGASSTSTSDNVVLPGTGNDVVVLGTTAGATTAASSNETVVIAPGFGNDTIVNFVTAGADADALDFTGLFTASATAPAVALAAAGVFTVDRSINIGAATDATAVANLFNAANAAAQEHVFVAVNAHNIGSVYSVVDPIGAANAVATLQGTIDLANTAWATLVPANVVNSAAAGYSLLNGGNGAVAVAPVVPPVVPGAATTTNISAALLTGTGTAGADTFNIASGTYSPTINNFGQSGADKIALFAGAAITVVPDANQADGIQVISAADAATGSTTTITLTGLTATQDAGIFNTASFNTIFGAGSLA